MVRHALIELSERITQRPPRIVVLGDLMLDHYRIAEATRISPEAPVPVLLNPQDEYRLGGAAAVALMCVELGAETAVIGCLGDDPAGKRVRDLLENAGAIFAGVIAADVTTTCKERICGVASGKHRQQLGRIDTEMRLPLSAEVIKALRERMVLMAEDVPDAVIIADYGKGVCQSEVTAACRDLGVPVFVDPPRRGDLTQYRKLTCVIPNREEAAGRTAEELMRALELQAGIVKLDRDGCEIARASISGPSETSWLRAHVRQVHDVTGAGDQFISVLALGRVCGLDWVDAATCANFAAGMQVERYGCVPVTMPELLMEAPDEECGGRRDLPFQSARSDRSLSTLASGH